MGTIGMLHAPWARLVAWRMARSCKADGRHGGCRFCGTGDYETVHCPASLCTFEPGLAMPAPPYNHYWEPQCWNSSAHILGCLADGIHAQCRYCGGAEYQNISCPAWSWQ